MDVLHQMHVFVRIVECGSFTAAANTLGISTGSTSRAMTELERRLRTRLLHRSTRRIALTPAGERYLQRCRQILADIQLADDEASSALERPLGTLRIHSLATIGQHYIVPAIRDYRTLYPGVSIKLNLSPLTPDLYASENDVAVVATSSSLPDSELVSHLLGTSFSILCASPEYASVHGLPKVPHELERHECLILETPVSPAHEWLLRGPKGSELVEVSGAIEVNIADSIATAIRAGMGIGALPVCAARQGLKDGTLIRVLPQYTLSKVAIYALHASRRYADARIMTWIQFLRSYLPAVIERDKQSLVVSYPQN